MKEFWAVYRYKIKRILIDGLFEKQVIFPVSAYDLNRQYNEFLSGLKDLYEEYWSAEEITGIVQQAPVANAEEIVSALPSEVNLWPAWDGEEGKKIVQEVLMGKGDGLSSDVKERIQGFVRTCRASTVSFVNSLPDKFKLAIRS